MDVEMLQQLSMSDPMGDIIGLQREFLASRSMETRRQLGQFFTGSVVSDYMSSLIIKPKGRHIRLLDAGAGTGILTASTALRCLDLGCKSVHAVLYEFDIGALANLEQTLKIIENSYRQKRATFTYEVRCADFVLTRPDKDENMTQFDISVINPPYFKYSVKGSPYAKAVSDLYSGDPNIYASFVAVAMACMKDNGQLVAITPRSFTNGLYFKGFRKYLLCESALEHIHIFKHRDKVFKNSDSAVLQENIICRFVKRSGLHTVTVTSSDCDEGISNSDERHYCSDLIIDSSNDHQIIRIPESAVQAEILGQAEGFRTTFEGAGYFISTGPVVEHRTYDYIKSGTNTDNVVPLYRPHNVTPLTARWTGHHSKDVSFQLKDGHDKHTINNGVYVLLKRFSSKDEKRRLVAGVHLPKKSDCQLVGFGNKTNYIGLTNAKLSAQEAYGLSGIFNSSFMDKYFRCISGNTQVNATEIRVMKFPSREQVNEIGRIVKNMESYCLLELDRIVNRILGIESL